MTEPKQVLSNLDELFSEEFLQDADREYELARIAGMAYELAEKTKIPRRELARRMGNVSPSTLQRLLDGAEAHNVTLDTLVRFAWACNHRVELSFQPIEAQAHLEADRTSPSLRPRPDEGRR